MSQYCQAKSVKTKTTMTQTRILRLFSFRHVCNNCSHWSPTLILSVHENLVFLSAAFDLTTFKHVSHVVAVGISWIRRSTLFSAKSILRWTPLPDFSNRTTFRRTVAKRLGRRLNYGPTGLHPVTGIASGSRKVSR